MAIDHLFISDRVHCLASFIGVLLSLVIVVVGGVVAVLNCYYFMVIITLFYLITRKML